MENSIKITDDAEEMLALGRQIVAENPVRYSSAMIQGLVDKYREFISDEAELRAQLFRAIYSQVVYGTSITEYGYYDFAKRTHAEKSNYVTWYNRYAYLAFLNNAKDVHLLDNKFEAYERLKPFYRREAMLLGDESDWERFRDFATRHRSLFVKPVNLELAEGARRLVIGEQENLRAVFESLLAEARNLRSEVIKRTILHQLIIEEEIVPSAEIAQFNPAEMSVLRVPTVQVGGEVRFFYPCFRMMCGDGKEQCGEKYSIDALIDAETGVLVTGGRSGIVEEAENHPVTGARILGFQLPEWGALREMLTQAAREFPSIRYVGWDVVHTPRGWCIIEGNPGGEFFFQLCVGHGVREEFERLIGFKFRLPEGFRWDVLLQDKENRGVL